MTGSKDIRMAQDCFCLSEASIPRLQKHGRIETVVITRCGSAELRSMITVVECHPWKEPKEYWADVVTGSLYDMHTMVCRTSSMRRIDFDAPHVPKETAIVPKAFVINQAKDASKPVEEKKNNRRNGVAPANRLEFSNEVARRIVSRNKAGRWSVSSKELAQELGVMPKSMVKIRKRAADQLGIGG